MADNKRISRSINNRINKLAKGIQDNIDNLYKSTYYSGPELNKDLQILSKRINDNLDKIADRNLQINGFSNISRLYEKMPKDLTKGDLGANLQSLFEDPIAMDNLYESFMNNKYLKDLDNEIDTLCRYMPSLAEALEVKKDNVLSADYFSKDYISINSSDLDDNSASTFAERCKNLKQTYDLLNKVEEAYSKAAKYGECFVYCVPYKTAIGRLLDNKDKNQIPDTFAKYGFVGENATTVPINETFMFHIDKTGTNINDSKQNKLVNESAPVMHDIVIDPKTHKRYDHPKSIPILQENESIDIQIEFNRSGIIDSIVENTKRSYEQRTQLSEMYSLNEAHMRSLNEANDTNRRQPEAKGNLSLGSPPDVFYSQDGLIDKSNGKNKNPTTVKVPGCVNEILKREQVRPIYIGNICMGYYYIEVSPTDYDEAMNKFDSTLGSPMSGNLKSGERTFNSVTDPLRQDELLKYIAGQMSNFIDKNFVNSNADLRKELYSILKYNDIFNTTQIEKIKVTYIAPEDIIHIYFKQDEETKRGISDLDKAIIPATIYCSVYLTEAIGTLTRGQDKRVYYVKQNVEQNIAQTMLTTIAQIKQSNFGARQFQDINNVLNISGRFNDYVIPVGPSDDYPIRFEVMQGQQFDSHTELLDKLDDMAINSTDVPKEIIASRQSIDYALQLSMSSSKFLRYLYNRQSAYQQFIQIWLSKIYNCEYDENVVLNVTLPPPSFLNVTNTTQLIDNTSNLANNIVDNELPNEDDKVKAISKKLLFRKYIGTHLDISGNEAIYEKARMLAKEESDEENN